jgi:hypothetical protein
MSANRLTTPMVKTKRDASESKKAKAGFFMMAPPWFQRAKRPIRHVGSRQ